MTETLLVANMTIKGASYFKTARLIFTPAMLNLKVCVCGGRGLLNLIVLFLYSTCLLDCLIQIKLKNSNNSIPKVFLH